MGIPAGERICSKIDEIAGELWRTSLFLHEHPETGYKEFQARDALVRAASSYGFEVAEGAGGVGTAFRAERSGAAQGPKVAFLAEYDALPEIGHACGHNLIASASLGAAAALGSLADELSGSVLLVGTPPRRAGEGSFA